mgnify:CR=1 FL=1
MGLFIFGLSLRFFCGIDIRYTMNAIHDLDQTKLNSLLLLNLDNLCQHFFEKYQFAASEQPFPKNDQNGMSGVF